MPVSAPTSTTTVVTPDAPHEDLITRRHFLDFDPAQDGFGFVNTFSWTDDDLAFLAAELKPLLRGLTLAGGIAIGSALGGRRGAWAGLGLSTGALLSHLPETVLGRLARQWASFGLCGGMALAAAERWPHRVGARTADLEREPIRALLRRRQSMTLRAAGIRFVNYWLLALGGAATALPLGEALDRELTAIQARIDSGRPVVIGLVGDAPDPFAMHQVVAFGYEVGSDDATTFSVYDPNSPGRTRHIRAQTQDGKAYIGTDLPTGPKRNGGFHISRTAGRLSMLFAVDVG